MSTRTAAFTKMIEIHAGALFEQYKSIEKAYSELLKNIDIVLNNEKALVADNKALRASFEIFCDAQNNWLEHLNNMDTKCINTFRYLDTLLKGVLDAQGTQIATLKTAQSIVEHSAAYWSLNADQRDVAQKAVAACIIECQSAQLKLKEALSNNPYDADNIAAKHYSNVIRLFAIAQRAYLLSFGLSKGLLPDAPIEIHSRENINKPKSRAFYAFAGGLLLSILLFAALNYFSAAALVMKLSLSSLGFFAGGVLGYFLSKNMIELSPYDIRPVKEKSTDKGKEQKTETTQPEAQAGLHSSFRSSSLVSSKDLEIATHNTGQRLSL